MSFASGRISRKSHFPPVNEDCTICHNLDPSALERGLEIRIHGNEDFRRSAAENCLACKVIRDGIMQSVASIKMFQKFTLRVRDKINVGGHDVERKNILLAELFHDRSSTDWTEGQPQPLWDQGRSYLKLCLEFYTRPGMFRRSRLCCHIAGGLIAFSIRRTFYLDCGSRISRALAGQHLG